MRIIRDPEEASRAKFDVIIIGGGIYGAMFSLEASMRGLSSLLLERDDFGAHTSFNSLRIIHGGFRYLKDFDLQRYRESVHERTWFLKTFPHYVRSLPCLMPLYGKGLYRPSIFRGALYLNELLSGKRNIGIKEDNWIPPGRILDRRETRKIFPAVDLNGLKGGAVWFDGFAPDSQRLLIDIIRWSCGLGAVALDYMEVEEPIVRDNHVAGVKALDKAKEESFIFNADKIVNAAGPWCREIASKFQEDKSSLFKPSIAWNVLFDRDSLSDHALAVTPERGRGRILFIVPWKGMMLAGTGYVPWVEKPINKPSPTIGQITEFIDEVNASLPGLNICSDDIVRIYSGFMPAVEFGSSVPATREVIIDHGKKGGIKGLYSISGVKFTTARLVAEKTLNWIFPDKRRITSPDQVCSKPPADLFKPHLIFDIDWLPDVADTSWKDILKKVVEEESVIHIDDLLFRRTSIGDLPDRALKVAPSILKHLNWEKEQENHELKRLEDLISECRMTG